MNSFLNELTKVIIAYNENGTDFRNLAIILPNKRAQRQLLQEIAKTIEHPIFPPNIFTINEWIGSLCPLTPILESEQLLILYQCYLKVATQHQRSIESFQDYLSWGEFFLSDINDIDIQKANAKEIFNALKDAIEIYFYDRDTNPLTENQRRTIDFYTLLFELYTEYRATLIQQKKGYTGLIYRDVAENIVSYAQNNTFSKIILAGFNAMTPTESDIIYYFYQNNIVDFQFDFDHFYLEYTKQIRNELHSTFKIDDNHIHKIGNHFAEENKKIATYGVSHDINQIYQALDIIKKIPKADWGKTAIVFADEALILPFIHAFNPSQYNVTMSYPVRYTLSYQLLDNLLTMAENIERFQVDTHTDAILYHKDVLTFYRNPLIANIFFKDNNQHTQFIQKIIQTHQIFYSQATLLEMLPHSLPVMTEKGTRFLNELQSYCQYLAGLTSSNEQILLLEFAKAMEKIQKNLSDYSSISDDFNAHTLRFFIEEAIQNISISFKGDANNGLQVMGLLETRILDFDHVIMLSVNEGIIPFGKKDNSLIFFDIKTTYNLSTYQLQDAIYAYHFFHLLQRATDIHLIYNTDSSKSLQEPSRFINILEFKIKNNHLSNIIHFQKTNSQKVYISPNNHSNTFQIIVNDTLRNAIKKHIFSASSLFNYICCPLRFYLQNIAHIKEEEQITESIGDNILGTIVHNILDELSKKITCNKNISPIHFITEWEEKIDTDYIEQKFSEQEELNGKDLSRGRLYLATEVVRKEIRNYLSLMKKELANNDITLMGSEIKVTSAIPLNDQEEALITGSIDRVDWRHNQIHILDYKTGKLKNLSFTSVENLFTDPKQQQLFQLFTYAYLYHKKNPIASSQSEQILCGIISFQNLMKGEADICYATENTTKNPINVSLYLEEYEKKLQEIITTIRGLDRFEQTNNLEQCKYCTYKVLCNRNE